MKEARVSEAGSALRRPSGRSGPPRDPARDARILRAATELLTEGGYPALTMDNAAARAGVGKATVYRRWKSRAELAAEALDHAGLTDAITPADLGPGQLRAELVATLASATWGPDLSRADLIAALLDTARQEPELCNLVRRRYMDSLHQAVEDVLAHAAERGDLPPRPAGPRPVEVSAAVALLLHWEPMRGERLTEDDIGEVVDKVLMPPR